MSFHPGLPLVGKWITITEVYLFDNRHKTWSMKRTVAPRLFYVPNLSSLLWLKDTHNLTERMDKPSCPCGRCKLLLEFRVQDEGLLIKNLYAVMTTFLPMASTSPMWSSMIGKEKKDSLCFTCLERGHFGWNCPATQKLTRKIILNSGQPQATIRRFFYDDELTCVNFSAFTFLMYFLWDNVQRESEDIGFGVLDRQDLEDIQDFWTSIIQSATPNKTQKAAPETKKPSNKRKAIGTGPDDAGQERPSKRQKLTEDIGEQPEKKLNRTDRGQQVYKETKIGTTIHWW